MKLEVNWHRILWFSIIMVESFELFFALFPKYDHRLDQFKKPKVVRVQDKPDGHPSPLKPH